MSRPVIVVGGGGHSSVVVDALQAINHSIIGFTDPAGKTGSDIWGAPYLGDDEVIRQHSTNDVLLANGLGSIGRDDRREKVFEEFRSRGYDFITLIHSAATVSPRARLDEGVQVMMGAVVQAGARLGPNVLVNTSASVDHDCRLDAHVHVAPGAVLSGEVRVGRGTLVGVGASVRQGTTVGEYSIVGAGGVVVDDVEPNAIVVGVPARPISR